MMLDGDVFVFDNVVHMYDLSDDNLKQPDNALDRHWHLAIGVARRPKGQDKAAGITDGYAAFARRWTSADLGKMLFADSSTDMAMAQAVPLFDVYKDGFAPVRAQYDFHQAFPEITETDKRRILGENQARMFGIDLAQKRLALGQAGAASHAGP